METCWHQLCRKPHLNLCICAILVETHLAAISSKTISPGGIATLQYLHYAKQSNQSGWSMYSVQIPAVVTEITLHFHIHALFLPAQGTAYMWCAWHMTSICATKHTITPCLLKCFIINWCAKEMFIWKPKKRSFKEWAPDEQGVQTNLILFWTQSSLFGEIFYCSNCKLLWRHYCQDVAPRKLSPRRIWDLEI